jgi:NAD(P)-dependent dehydrogenase (short-subunit alcohol dehydrogenase family)
LLAEQGATVVIVARDPAGVNVCVAALAGSGHRALAMDVSDEGAWRSDQALAALDGVDGVVTAAAVLAPVGPIGTYRPEDFWQTMRVNVLGTLLAVDACVDSLEAARARSSPSRAEAPRPLSRDTTRTLRPRRRSCA